MFDAAKIKGGVSMLDSIYLEESEYSTISNELIRIPEYETPLLMSGFPVETVNPSKKDYTYNTVNRYGEATVVKYPGDFKALSIDKEKVKVEIPWIGVAYELQIEDIENSKNGIEPLDASLAIEAGYATQQMREEALWSNSSIFGTLGIYGQAGGTFSSAADWSTNTTNITDQVRLWIGTIDQRYSAGPKVLAVANAQFLEMKRPTWSNGTVLVLVPEGSFYGEIKKTFPELEILNEPQATAGTGVLYPKNRNVARLISAVPLIPVDIDEDAWKVTMAAAAKERLVVPTPAQVIKTASI